MPQLTWLITGCSSGFGECLAFEILSRGDRVIATARNGLQRLETLREAGAAIMDLDVCSSQERLDEKIEEALEFYGGIDVIVNNAGYIEAALLEDVGHERMLASFNTNIFGAVNLTRAILPHFRQQRSGIVVFMGSVGGWQGEVGAGSYCATKFAMEGILECLQKETQPFGIQSIIFEPSYYRTKIMHKDNVKIEPLKVPEYKEMHNAMLAGVEATSGNEPGDPNLGARFIVDVVRQEGVAEGKDLPPRLPIGPVGLEQLRNKCLATMKILEEWETQILGH